MHHRARNAPHLLEALVDELESLPADQAGDVAAQQLLTGLGLDHMRELHLGLAQREHAVLHDRAGLADILTAEDVDVAGDGAQQRLGDRAAGGVVADLVAAADTPNDDAGAVVGVALRRLADLAGRSAGDLGCPLGGALAHVVPDFLHRGADLDLIAIQQRDGVILGSPQLVGNVFASVTALIGKPNDGLAGGLVPADEVLEAGVSGDLIATDELLGLCVDEERRIGPVLQERLVVEAVGQDRLDPGEHDGQVGAGTRLDPVIAVTRHLDALGIDHDQTRTHGLGQHLLVQTPCRALRAVLLVGVDAPQHDAVGVEDGRRQRELDLEAADRHVDGVDPAPANLTGIQQVAGIAEQIREAAAGPQMAGAVGALSDRQGLGAVFLPQRVEALRDLVKRLLVGNLLPLAGAALAHALESVVHAILVVVELDHALAMLAHALAHDRVLLLVGADLVDRAVGVDAD